MAWRYDNDLLFLEELKNDDLELLFSILTRDPKDGEIRYTEEIIYSDEYKRYGSDYHKYWRTIGAELQTYGGNTVMTIFRGGKGVLYREVLEDVCDQLKIKYYSSDTTKEIEEELIYRFLEKAIEEMSEEERKNLAKDLNINTLTAGKITKGVLKTAIKRLTNKSIAELVIGSISKILLSRGVVFAGSEMLIATLTGPIGMVVMGAWTTIDIASAAMRVTIPATIIVSALRTINDNN